MCLRLSCAAFSAAASADAACSASRAVLLAASVSASAAARRLACAASAGRSSPATCAGAPASSSSSEHYIENSQPRRKTHSQQQPTLHPSTQRAHCSCVPTIRQYLGLQLLQCCPRAASILLRCVQRRCQLPLPRLRSKSQQLLSGSGIQR